LAAFSALKRIATCFAGAIELWLSGAQARKHFFFEKRSKKLLIFGSKSLLKTRLKKKVF
jgi:hypothetical protein